MSGIVGNFDVDGQPVEADTIGRMLAAIAHRGPDGLNQWTNQSIGLGHCMLRTTPESLQERQPLHLDTLTIVADARIDNREELFHIFETDTAQRAQMPDCEVILNAYIRWGRECVNHLLGDFAFAIWDEAEQLLFCARDHFGLKPFYYYQDGNRFYFSSEIQAILAVLPTRPAIREQTIIDWILNAYTDKTHTFFENINRLPPAHFLTIEVRSSLSINQYWQLDPEREIHLGSDDEYVQQFRELFAEAVRCRLRSAVRVGTTLSGGLDSSSVTCMTRDLLGARLPGANPVPTFSAIMPDVPRSNEEHYQQFVVNSGGIEPHTFRADRLSPLSAAYEIFDHLGQPLDGGNEFIDWYTLKLAHENGVRIVLNGYDGDNTVSHGDALMRELALNGDWETFQQHTTQLARRVNLKEVRVRETNIQGHVMPALRELRRRGEWSKAATTLYQMNAYFGYSKRRFVKDFAYAFFPQTAIRLRSTLRRQPLPFKYEGIFTSEALHRYELVGMTWPRDSTAHAVTSRSYQYARLTSATLTRGIEESETKGAALGIEVRSPFCDRRLLEFSLAVPAEQKMRDGQTRSLLRRAMDGILPPEIRDRMVKSDLQPNFYRGFSGEDREKIELVRKNLPDIMPFIDENVFSERVDSYLQQGRGEYELNLWRVISAGLWLLYQKSK